MKQETDIAICDDDFEDMMDTMMMVKQYANRTGQEIRIHLFRAAQELLQSDKRADIYLLDIMMPEMGGIEGGKEIRSRFPDCSIVYLTSSPEYALEAFSVYAEGYLLKPVQEDQLGELLDRILKKRMHVETPEYLAVKIKEGIVRIDLKEIIYVENVSRTMQFHLSDGRVITSLQNRMAFEQQLEPLLSRDDFMRSHKSFVVNMQYIDEFTTGEYLVAAGTQIPISRANYMDAKRKYLRYLSGGELS